MICRSKILTLAALLTISCGGQTEFDKLYHRGNIAYQDRDYETALSFLLLAHDQDSTNLEVYNDVAFCYWRLDSLNQALAFANMGLELDNTYSRLYNCKGKILEAMQLYDESLLNFNRAIELEPDRAVFYFNRGRLFFNKFENYQSAISDFDLAVELGFSSWDLFNYRGCTYARLNMHKKAVSDFNIAITLDSTNARGYRNRATSLNRTGKYNDAIEDLNHAIRLEPNNQLGYSYRGRIHRLNRNYKAAFEDLNIAISLDSLDYNNYMCRGVTYYNTGDYVQSEIDLRKSLTLAKNDVDSIDILGGLSDLYSETKHLEKLQAITLLIEKTKVQ